MVAFCLVLLPLLGLAWQAYQSFDELSNQAAQISISTVQDARRSEEMSSPLEMERSYRQYCVLGNETLKNVWHKQYLRYEDYLARQKQSTPDPRYTDDIAGSLGQLSVLQCENGEPVAAMTTHRKPLPAVTLIWCRLSVRRISGAVRNFRMPSPAKASHSAGRACWCLS